MRTRTAKVFLHGTLAGVLCEEGEPRRYAFHYAAGYCGPSISLTLPVREEAYSFERFPAVFDGLLPEGVLLDSLLKSHKIDHHDHFSQLMVVGGDLVGAITVEEEQ